MHVILLYVSLLVSFGIVYLLYHVPLSSYLYSIELSLLIVCVAGVLDYYDQKGKYVELKKLEESIELSYSYLPESKDPMIRQYHELIWRLGERSNQLTHTLDEKQSDWLNYITMWTHQIKTPIAGMNLLLQSGEDSPMRSNLKKELFKVEQYVEMVLQYLRLDTMSSDLLLKEYEISSIIRQAVKKYSILFIQNKISLQLDSMNACILTDEKWFEFVLEQILSNALKYTTSGSIKIYLDDFGCLVIEDTGIGIHKEDIPRIFERGFTGCNGRMDKKSTGIGLYLCKQILTRLNHTIRVESEIGVGTKVNIDFSREHLELAD